MKSLFPRMEHQKEEVYSTDPVTVLKYLYTLLYQIPDGDPRSQGWRDP